MARKSAGVPHVRYRLPSRCKYCEATDAVVPQVTIVGATVTLTWWCRVCGKDWSVTEAEQDSTERRAGRKDRRRVTRADRRRTGK